MKSKTRRIEPIKTLIAMPQKEQKPDAFQDMALIQGIEKIQKDAYTITQRVLKVKGFTWGGNEAEHEYRLGIDDTEPTTLLEAERIAGDFESLDSATVVTVTKEIKETKTFQKLK